MMVSIEWQMLTDYWFRFGSIGLMPGRHGFSVSSFYLVCGCDGMVALVFLAAKNGLN